MNLVSDSIQINADPQKVWSIITDFKSISERSPQCRKMFIVKGKPVGLGTKTYNINGAGFFHWISSADITEFDVNRRLAFRVNLNKSIWSYDITPNKPGEITLTESRNTTNSKIFKKFFANEKESIMTKKNISKTLKTIKTLAEANN